MKYPFNDLEVNCKSHLSLLETCKIYNPKVKIIFSSTRQVYGNFKYLPVDENHPLNPPDVNGINKLAAEYYYKLYNNIYGVKSVIFRLTNTYGPGQLIKNNKQGFTGIYFREALLNNVIKIKGDGQLIRDFNYVSDVVDAFFTAIINDECWGEVFNLGADNYYTIIDFLEILNKYCNLDYQLIDNPSDQEKISLGDYYGSYKKFNDKTGWLPQTQLDKGIKLSIKYYKKFLSKYLD